MSSGFIIIGTGLIALLLAGYFAQRYLPPPPPKVLGIDLGTTYSCIGMYHAISGNVTILETQDSHKCIPSVVAFTPGGVLVGYRAEAQAERNPLNTLYDAKRFIGKKYSAEELNEAQKQYAFKLKATPSGFVNFHVVVNDTERVVSPEEVGYYVIRELMAAAERNLSARVNRVVMSVPAEFDDLQRNYTIRAGNLADLDVLRVINEPTAAAMAYGLHTRTAPHNIMVVDLGGGTLDVSLLNVQGGMFLTQAMAGNNHLGGQDFNQRLMTHLLKVITSRHAPLTHREDIQGLRLAVEQAKLGLTFAPKVTVSLTLHSLGEVTFKEVITRTLFEEINSDLFAKVLDPIKKVLESTEMYPEDVDEIVLVGGSTRVPRVQQVVAEFMGQVPKFNIDPELAVVTGVSVQAGILGGMWPLTVSAVELPARVRKVKVT